MLDERWSEDVEEIADALRRILTVESAPERVRRAEGTGDGRDLALEAALADFGLKELEADPELFARIAFELGRALATTDYVETIAVLALTGKPGIGYSRGGPLPASLERIAMPTSDGVMTGVVGGTARTAASGARLVIPTLEDLRDNEHLGDAALGDRIDRYDLMVQSARMIGAAKALLSYGVDYAKEREQFGKIIGTYQGVAHRLARVSGDLDAADLLLRKAAFMAKEDVGGDGAPPRLFALMLHAKAIQASRLAATNVHQVFGGNGFAMEYDVQLYSRRLREWSMRGDRPKAELAEVGRIVLDPARRDAVRLLWHYDTGMPLPRWAEEADTRGAATR